MNFAENKVDSEFNKLIKLIYLKDAEFPEKMRKEIDQFGEMDKEKRELALWKRIERIARNIPDVDKIKWKMNFELIYRKLGTNWMQGNMKK
jgi:hypothetical protein